MSDFIMTIDEDEDIQVYESDDNEIEETKSKKKNNKNKEINSSFKFDIDKDIALGGSGHPWDFTQAKAALKKHSTQAQVSIDEIIERKRNQNKNNDSNDEEDDDSIGDENDDDEDDIIDGEDEDEEDDNDDDDDDDGDTDESESESDEEDEVSEQKKDEEENEEEDEDIVQQKRKAAYFAPAPEVNEDLTETFTTMSLSRPILKGISNLGFVKPTPIQARAIPIAMQGLDICGSATTGSGKTAAFVIPILERLLYRPKAIPTTRVLILVPTRELGAQVHSVAQNLAKFTDIQFSLLVGGLSSNAQKAELRRRPDVIIATPGRLIDHIRNSVSFTLETIEILIMDEADRMLEEGFAAELNEIIKNCPKGRQTMLFSATMTDNIDQLVKLSLNRPVRLFVNSNNAIANNLIQEFIRIRQHREEDRPAILAALCSRTYKSETIIFFRSKAAAHYMKIVFGLLGLNATELHGNLTQLQRLESLESFRDRKTDFLLATDLASRGLDIAGIKTVINYDMPQLYQQYVHRVGRTARADQGGRAVSLIGEADRKVLKLAIKNSTSEVKHRIIPSAVIAKYKTKINGFKNQIKEILDEEKEEKAIRIAEMEANKATNILKYQEEINSRPAKTWFQTEKEKKLAKEIGKAKYDELVGVSGNKDKQNKKDLNRNKKRRLEALSEADREAIKEQQYIVREAKRAKKPKKITYMPTPNPNANSKPKPNKKKAVKSAGFENEIKSTSEIKNKASSNKEGNRETREIKKERKRLGKKKSVKAFKSKSKYKRRH
ncbi:DEAD-domain-containing protein [Neocallimastix californiae]|uniref:ATP-dependent RNA helicase DRS1 n=1 Tax=Neocallimastix californiae TaxID=1754190 RepID=A0A1Y2C9E3_9FUNG|nr:DEAD-domain-containing protein [Neocallimastix californiae]|eukprot:ORY43527.1 DEAD-domain-containing protein [Neocallimastix californiae]